MFIFDTPRVFDGSTLRLPLYHRGHLSLFEGAQVAMVALPGPAEKPHFPELVLSTISTDSWDDLWEIRVAMRDRIGLVREVLQVLSEENLNILTAESTSMERDSLHIVEVICDARKYESPFLDKDYAERKRGRISALWDIERAIVAALLPDLAINSSGLPQISSSRLESLYRCSEAFTQAKNTFRQDGSTPAPALGKPKVERDATDESRVFVRLPLPVQDLLNQCLGPASHGAAKPHYLIVSDTRDRFMRAYFTPASERLMTATVRHQEEVGALASITRVLVHEKINILTMLSRLKEQGKVAETEFVLSTKYSPQLSLEEQQQMLRRALTTRELVGTYGIQLSFGHRYSNSRESFQGLDAHELRADPADRSDTPSVPAKLEWLVTFYDQKLSDRKPKGDDFLRRRIAMRYLDEERHLRGQQRNQQLFISSTFAGSYMDIVRKHAEQAGFHIITGERLPGTPTKAEGVIKKIEQCTHFLGVWTQELGTHVAEGKGQRKQFYPSPWMIWELGVAQALGKTWKLAVHKDIFPDAWNRINADPAHVHFDGADFETKLEQALWDLSRQESHPPGTSGHMRS